MMLAVLFVCGVANFALSKALIESDHPILETLPAAFRRNGGRVSLAFEFGILLIAMLLAANDWPSAAWLYAGYTAANAVFGWLVATGRL